MKKLFIMLISLLTLMQAHAQDHTFSQFLAAPLYLNPALTGVTRGAFRMNLAYRNQWPGVPGAFEYVNASIDSRVDFVNGGLGLMFNRSSEGQGYLTRNSVFGIYNFIVPISRGGTDISWFAAFGAGVTSRSLDVTKLKFGDQFDQWRQNLPGVSTAYGLVVNNNRLYPDFQAGTAFQVGNLMLGMGVQHMVEPDESFTGAGSLVPRRWTFHAAWNQRLDNPYRTPNDPVLFQPTFMIANQSSFSTMNIGFVLKKNFWNTGLFYRQSRGFADNDAIIISFGFDTFRARHDKNKSRSRLMQDQLKVGLSYDATVSALGSDQTFGSVETAVTYEAPVNPWWDNVFYQGQKQLYGGARSNRRSGGGIGGFFSRLFNGGNLPSSRTRCYDFMW